MMEAEKRQKFYDRFRIDVNQEGGRVVEKLGLSKDTVKILKANHIYDLKKLLFLTEIGLYSLPRIDGKFVDEVLSFLSTYKSRGYINEKNNDNSSYINGNNLSRYQILKQLIKRTNIYLEDELISNERVLELEMDFLVKGIRENNHDEAFYLHAGSSDLYLYDAVALVVGILTSLVLDEYTVDEQIDDFEPGMTVIYNNNKYKYEGFCEVDNKGFYKLIGKDKKIQYVNEKNRGLIIPYNGSSETLDGRGLRKITKRTEFLKEVVGFKENEITSVPGVSTVIYMEQKILDYLLDEITIEFGDYRYKLLELATISFFTATKEIYKKGNTGKNEPLLKVTNNIERASELVKDRRTIGFIVCDDEVLRKNAIEFEALLKRKRTLFGWLIIKKKKNDWLANIIEENEDIRLLALTPNKLRITRNKAKNNNLFADRLAAINRIEQKKEITGKLFDSPFKWGEYRKIRWKLESVLNDSLDNEYSLQFVYWAYSVLKLFNTILIPIGVFEVNSGREIYDEIELYKTQVELMPSAVREYVNEIILYIESVYRGLHEVNPKLDYIKANSILATEKKKVAIVVPSKYTDIINNSLVDELRNYAIDFQVITENTVQNIDFNYYDEVLYSGLLNFDKYNPFEIKCSERCQVLLFDSQIRLFNSEQRKYNQFLMLLDNRMGIEIVEHNELEDNEVIEDSQIEKTINDSFMKIFIESEKREYQSSSMYSRDNHSLTAYRYGHFDTGESILFTKGYVAYVFNLNEGTVDEVSVDELKIGAKLIFTVNDNKTKDIVDEILDEYVKDDQVAYDALVDVLYWKNEISKFKEERDFSYNELSEYFTKKGENITPQRLRGWLEPETHIVGPRESDKEIFKFIGREINCSELEQNFEKYSVSTGVVRSTRRKILGMIQEVIVADLRNKEIDEKLKKVIEKIRAITVIKDLDQLEVIEPFEISVNRANRPIES
ncbi:DrmE family protein [Butyrivibrio fibrisolvens]|uniref:DrmE family protein n=1 Tax=Pseudobutyrivibrio ruminis TaxID=46206 RepID=UPI0003F65C29|nr:DrmE family protein [Pseudobutyrivibrio ruminis]MDC7278056.1 DrmE family protein [Butyrivibrio fibrisolvens]